MSDRAGRDAEPRLIPPDAPGHVSVARLPDYWYVACRSRDLRSTPIARTVLGTPVALFRGGRGTPGAVLDRCPHRNVPLSQGRVVASGHLECRYHGWQFDVEGACRLVPGLVESGAAKGRRVEAFPVREQGGLVWLYGRPDAAPACEPFALPLVGAPGYTTVVREVEAPASVHATAENTLDVPHTAYLHKGLFRGGDKHRIEAIVRRWPDRVEAEYVGEPRPPGIVGRLLSPSGGVVEHWDRFILPSVAQVEYRLGAENHIVVTSLMTPITDFHTRLFAVISFRVRLPGRLVRLALEPLAMRIFRQDADILAEQTASIHRFGGERFMSTDVDVLGREIWRLMKHAEGGTATGHDEEPTVRKLELLV